MAKTTDSITIDMNLLGEWCREVLQYLGAHGDQQTKEVCRQMAEVVNRESRNPKAMKSIARDLEEWTRALPQKEIAELDTLLRANLDVGLKEAQRNRTKAVAGILQRNSIKTEEEYRLLLSHVDEIYSDPSKAVELESINALLRSYEPMEADPSGGPAGNTSGEPS
jgi:hypothetical protein